MRIYSRPLSLRKDLQWEEFCQIKVLLHVHHRDLQQLTENETVAWSTLYNCYLEEINADLIDLLGPPRDNEEDEEQLKNDEQNEFQLN